MPPGFELAVAAAVVAGGYFVFGVSGFGSALLTVPVLSHFWPVQFVLPVVAMLDVASSLFLGVRHHRQAERGELARLIPAALLGAAAGVTLLVNLPREAVATALGIFVVLYGAYAFVGRGAMRPVSRHWAYLAGAAGGASGALFGVGGPPYVIYLSRRLPDKSVLRATLATLVVFSVGGRLVLFAVAGLVTASAMQVALVLLPFAYAGMWAGARAHVRLSPVQFARFISLLLIAMGVSLLVRRFAG